MADRAGPGRRAFERGSWREAFALLRAADLTEQDDLERLAVAAHLVGATEDCEAAWERAHRRAATHGDADAAARCAFWLGFDLLLRGEDARAGGWLARAERFASDADAGPARGYLLVPQFLQTVHGGDATVALELATEMVTVGRAAGDDDLVAFGVLCRGEALLAAGRIAEGMRCLDEVMLSVTTGEVSVLVTGVVYCAVIEACVAACDLRRAAAWTEAWSAWCEVDPSLVAFRGQCLVYRSQVLMARGAWDRAGEEAEEARRRLATPAHPALGEALYQQAELHRRRGDLAQAEHAYRDASRHGRDPVPGFALVRLAQGRTGAAAAAARRMLDETGADPNRPAILAAVVEILVASHELDGAEHAVHELEQRAALAGTDLLRAMAATARGSVLLARGDAAGAASVLRDAITAWHGLDMPFEEAQARACKAKACRALGDDDGAVLEEQAARAAFSALGARTELTRLGSEPGTAPLTTRERDVIRRLATGSTNRQIAADLSISEHTVARHLQNIFVKLDVPSRAAATAYAHQHGLV
jgi:DNA-binding NarL/FixJ family response regulator